MLGCTLLLIAVVGCTMSKSNSQTFTHEPPLAAGMTRLVKGITTRNEVLRYFGEPDLEVAGSVVTIAPDGPMRRIAVMASEMAAQAIEHPSARKPGAKEPRQERGFDPNEWMRLHPYSSIDDEHTALIYWEVDSQWQLTTPPPLLPFALFWSVRIRETVLRNQLLIFVNRRTGLVETFSYQEEFPPE
jgi:hypothetical protein